VPQQVRELSAAGETFAAARHNAAFISRDEQCGLYASLAGNPLASILVQNHEVAGIVPNRRTLAPTLSSVARDAAPGAHDSFRGTARTRICSLRRAIGWVRCLGVG
jgi:hypothetical protein